ncbi:MAG: maleylpyruvate isomerase N-terminal domain-containing protein [Actinomycetota bacterium]|nr:maleylpyruvate isomerase N-terminal domain-containing protein [Actinomycetota bacterium]
MSDDGGGDGDVVERLRTVVDLAGPVVAGTPDADLDRPTPCADWTVRDLVGHMTDALAMFADGAGSSFDEVGDAAVTAWSAPGRLC